MRLFEFKNSNIAQKAVTSNNSVFIVYNDDYITFVIPSLRDRTPESASVPPSIKLTFDEVADPARSPVCTDIM